jgi:hypothetical protein
VIRGLFVHGRHCATEEASRWVSIVIGKAPRSQSVPIKVVALQKSLCDFSESQWRKTKRSKESLNWI